MTERQFSESEIKDAVRKRYAGAIARPAGSCCGPAVSQPTQIGGSCCSPAASDSMKGTMAKVAGYGDAELAALPADALQNSFGCGNPLAFAGVKAGQTVLDIGSGAGIDCLIAAAKVGPSGKVIGLDMTPEMIERARRNAKEAGAHQVTFRLGEAEQMPVEDASVDWLISNCVINLSPDKPAVFREIARVLRPGGRISISDIVADDLPEAVRGSRDAWTGCLAGAISEAAYLKGLEEAGLREVRVTSRIVYEAGQLQGLFASSCCGIDSAAGHDASSLAQVAAGKIWSARFEGVEPPVPTPVASPRSSSGRRRRKTCPGFNCCSPRQGFPPTSPATRETSWSPGSTDRSSVASGWRWPDQMPSSAPWRWSRRIGGEVSGGVCMRPWRPRPSREEWSGRTSSPPRSPRWPSAGGSIESIGARFRTRSGGQPSSAAPAARRPWRCAQDLKAAVKIGCT